MTSHKLIVAAAGSGKTTYLVKEALSNTDYLVKEALSNTDARILITTFTDNNEEEIKKKFYEKNGCIPKHVTVQTWFSVLLQHGVRPYQGCLDNRDIKGMRLVQQSAPYTSVTDIKHYLDIKLGKIYSDKIAKFVCECNKKSNHAVISRLSQIYTHLFIDEVQDLAGYDLEFLKLLFKSKISTCLVGDPRQATYSTNNAPKNKKYKGEKILSFFEDPFFNDPSINIEKTDLTTNYRCVDKICRLSDSLFPDYQKTTSCNTRATDHDGCFFVKKQDVPDYLNEYAPQLLRYHDRAKIPDKIPDTYPVMNFGASKGLSFDRVLIVPTDPIKKWLRCIAGELEPISRSKYVEIPIEKWLRNGNAGKLKPISRSKLYVAMTRARQSVAFVFDYDEIKLKNDQSLPLFF